MDRSLLLVAGRHHVQHHRCGVDRGHEEDHDEHDRDERDDPGEREMPEEFEERTGDVTVVHHTLDQPTFTVEFDVEGPHPEDAEPDHGEEHGQAEHTADELADCAAAGNPGDEDTDERRPGDRPCPVEDGPRVLPACQVIAGRENVIPR